MRRAKNSSGILLALAAAVICFSQTSGEGPSGLIFSTVFGGLSKDVGHAIALDPERNIWIAGVTSSRNFPLAGGAFAPRGSGEGMAFVTKLSPDGVQALYSSYLGGSSQTVANAIAVDREGNVYITGSTTSGDFPTTAGVFQPRSAGASDIFLVKLDSHGRQIYATCLGGKGDDAAHALFVNNAGEIFLAGSTSSSDFPATQEGVQRRYGGGASDAFVVRISPTASRLLYSTFLGGSGAEQAKGITVAATGNIIVTGETGSGDFPAGAARRGGNTDIFVTRLSRPDRSAATRIFGGSGNESPQGMARDRAGAIYVAGWTESPDFPTSAKTFQSSPLEGSDGFLMKLDPAAQRLLYSTCFGGSGFDEVHALALDARGAVWIAGATDSPDLPVTLGASPNAGERSDAAFLAAFGTSANELIYATYFGSNGNARAHSLAVDSAGNATVTGEISGGDFPLTPGLFRPAGGGGTEVFVARFRRVAYARRK